MNSSILKSSRFLFICLLFTVCLCELVVFFLGPFGMPDEDATVDFLFLALIVFHFAWGVYQLFSSERYPRSLEILLAISLVLFLISYIFALNANMDYVQRFAKQSDNLRVAPDSTIARMNSYIQYLPFLIADLLLILFLRTGKRKTSIARSDEGKQPAVKAPAAPSPAGEWISRWAIVLTILSAFLYTISFPSFVSLNGIPYLAWISLVPLFLVIYYAPRKWGIFYGIAFGVVQTVLTNYWLGTFSLISLQLITILYTIFFILFMLLAAPLPQTIGRYGLLLIPCAWVAFDFFRSIGFLGYSWGMIGTSQYEFIPLIQAASVTGVWGISFIVLACNGVIAFTVTMFFDRVKVKWSIPVGFSVLFAVVVSLGAITSYRYKIGRYEDTLGDKEGEARNVTVALVQQNTDPRKSDYARGLEVLAKLTNRTLAASPDLVVWSETAFVPNIRYWSTYDPGRYRYAAIVENFLEYQQSIGTWLITGNDDYFFTTGEDGEKQRLDYNASVLFSPDGTRVDTYHKNHLVPFTEYFPFKKQLPWLYEILLNFDVFLWEPGVERTGFQHPLFSFCTPICFEDGFPNDVRLFVRKGAEVIINLSNDYWSLNEIEAKQHFTNSLFRAVENRRPLLRATASGLTAQVDELGRLIDSVPYYEEAFLIARFRIGESRNTFYTMSGDWFPLLCAFIVVAAYLFQALQRRHRRTGREL